MKPTILSLLSVIVIFSALSCKRLAGPLPQSSALQLDSMHWLPNAKTNNASYRFYYDAGGYVIKMIQYDRPDTNNDATGTRVSISVDSFVYDGNHRLAQSYSRATYISEGWGIGNYSYDNLGRLVLITEGSATGGDNGFERYSYQPDGKPSSLCSYGPDSSLQSVRLFSYGADGNVSARTDSDAVSHTARHYLFRQYDKQHNFALLLKGITYYNILGELFPVLCTNNCTEQYSVDSDGEYTTVYEYNANGYPVKQATSLPGTLGMVTTYFYSN